MTPSTSPSKQLKVLYELSPRLKKDFSAFATYMFALKGMRITPMQVSMCRFMQPDRANQGKRDKIILSYRGVGKTRILTFLSLWFLSKYPSDHVVFIGAEREKGMEVGQAVRNMIDEHPIFTPIRPKRNGSDRSFNVRGHITDDRQPSFRAYGIRGQITGARAGLIIMDDCETSGSAEFVSAAVRLRKVLGEMFNVQSERKSHQAKVIFGTPHTTDSFYTAAPSTHQSIILRVWPALYPDPSKCDPRYLKSLDPTISKRIREDPAIVGTPTDRLREDLREKPGYPDGLDFRLQYQMDTYIKDLDTFPFRCSDLIIYNFSNPVPSDLYWSNESSCKAAYRCPGKAGDGFYHPRNLPKDQKFQRLDTIVAYVDPASGGIDELAVAIAGHAAGKIWVFDVQGFSSDVKATRLETVAELLKRHEVPKVIIESNHSEAFLELLRSKLHALGHRCVVEGKHVHQSKGKRIYGALGDLFAQHRIVIHDNIIKADCQTVRWNGKSLFSQIANFNAFSDKSLKHDDRLDALAGVCEELSPYLRVDPERDRFETMTHEQKLMEYLHATATGDEDLMFSIAGRDKVLEIASDRMSQYGGGVESLECTGLSW